jgi:uncharacterized membrane protein
MNALLAASAVFFLLHMLPATPLRAQFVSLAGEPVYTAIFSIVSAAAIWWMVLAFNAAPYGEKLWAVPALWQWLKAALVLIAYILIVAGISTPNPYAPGGKVPQGGFAGGGIFAITRHPVMWGIAIWGIVHAISQPSLRGIVFFGGFAATALVGSWLQQRRKRAQLPGWAEFEARTSFWPFGAILEGRASFSLSGIGWGRIGVGALLWAVILYFHLSWFGAQPLPIRF